MWWRQDVRLWSNTFQVASASFWSRQLPRAQPTPSWRATRVIAAKSGPLLTKRRTGVGATTEADAALWCARLTSASAQELACFWIINYRARFPPFACHSLPSPSLSYVCTQIPNVHFSFHTSVSSVSIGWIDDSQWDANGGLWRGTAINPGICLYKKKRKGKGCATIVSRAVSCPLCYGAMLFSAVLPPPDLAASSKAQETSGQA